ncbi:MAG TPA: NADH-quinone oxidoreductase subunit L [Burkholderiales bacterium]|jgi:NADH-quinone oxidoreductase subunit L|nr:NADH-quinone oxidoreductase subunit L [Burkholderiales bacterium]
MKGLYLLVPLAPLAGSIIAGLFGRQIGRAGAHWVTILGMTVSTAAAALVFLDVLAGNTFDGAVYTWATSGGVRFEIGFLIDRLSATMMLVVSFVSLMVHIYTIGYMADDPGYQRFFSYISLFTFSMLMLVMSNNFLQLFFGWEAVGLVSYLLIGFWYTRPSANYAALKAFLVNRVGDLGFLLGVALILTHFGTLHYADVFAAAPAKSADLVWSAHGIEWPLITTVCLCLFVGAMGKSAQFPLHVWLPDSMEGPTPISALIHAATMVTAGIFMVARMSPLFELSEAALSFVMVIGAITALFMGLLGIVQNDIKRVVAYSTLSQLGYMTAALGASAYSIAIFHLMTHAFFKALLFLGAGSVIIALHHDQDMRRMGGLRRYMPITWITSLIGTLALIGFPFLSGFYSKDSIIEAVHLSRLPGAGFAYAALTVGVFVTALYSFRMYFLVFEGKERFAETASGRGAGVAQPHGHDAHRAGSPRESPPVVWLPLVALALPSMAIGAAAVGPLLSGFFGDAIRVSAQHDVVAVLAAGFHGWLAMAVHGFGAAPFWLAAAGAFVAWYLYLKRPDLPARIQEAVKPLYVLLEQKYYFDRFNDWFFAGGARAVGRGLWRVGDEGVIDGVLVNGSARLVAWFAGLVRKVQSGFIYHYAFTMIVGVFILLTIWFARA